MINKKPQQQEQYQDNSNSNDSFSFYPPSKRMKCDSTASDDYFNPKQQLFT